MNPTQRAFEAGQQAQRAVVSAAYEGAQMECLRAVEAVQARTDLTPKQRKALAADIAREFFRAHNPTAIGE